mmetsp:Transcript_4047/g.4561  ORF Transcript_4047/g.4561 Transcript_4047/m.4561 type:complete len:501 (-) Transcript_4047:181-1683(-)
MVSYSLLLRQHLMKIRQTTSPVVTVLKNHTNSNNYISNNKIVAAVERSGGGGGAAAAAAQQQRRHIPLSSLSLLSPPLPSSSSSSLIIGKVNSYYSNNKNNRCLYYHSSHTYYDSQQHQLLQDQNNSNSNNISNTILPSNLTFDLKSSFAPLTSPSPSPLLREENLDDDDRKIIDAADIGVSSSTSLSFSSSPVGIINRHQQLSLRPVQPLPDRLKIQIRDGPKGSSSTNTQEEDDDDNNTNTNTGVVGSIWLEDSIFGIDDIRIDLIKQNVDYIRNKIRGVRKAKTKTISEVSGSGRKVRPQKGGGTARAGHSRPAHWRGGAKAHGPKNTVNYGDTKLNKNIKKLAMQSMLSQKLKEGNLIIVNHLMLESHKTRNWAKILHEQYGVGKTVKKKNKKNRLLTTSTTTTALIVDHYLEPDNNNNNKTNNDENEKNQLQSQTQNHNHASYHGVPINLWVATSNIPRVMVKNQRFLNVYDILKKEKLIITLSALEEIEKKWSE